MKAAQKSFVRLLPQFWFRKYITIYAKMTFFFFFFFNGGVSKGKHSSIWDIPI